MKKLFLILLLSPLTVFASDKPVDAYLNKACDAKLTVEIKDNNFLPKEFIKSNNLRNFGDGFEQAKGKKIKFYGRLFDKNCIPVSGAIIKIWHANSFGVHTYELNSGAEYKILAKAYDKNFAGNGETSTDNNGRFQFVTIMPGDSPASINYIVQHPELKELQSKIYFSQDVKKDSFAVKLPKQDLLRLIAVKLQTYVKETPVDVNEKIEDIYLIDIIMNQEFKDLKY